MIGMAMKYSYDIQVCRHRFDLYIAPILFGDAKAHSLLSLVWPDVRQWTNGGYDVYAVFNLSKQEATTLKRVTLRAMLLDRFV